MCFKYANVINCTALWFVFSVTLCKDNPSGIYGISGPSYPSKECSLLKFDVLPIGGNFSVVQVPNIDIQSGAGLGCLDAVHNIYFFIYQTKTYSLSALYAYNLADPAVIYNTTKLPINPYETGDACISDPKTGDVFVFGKDSNEATNQLLLRVSFDPITNKSTITQIGAYMRLNQFPVATSLAVYDSNRNKLWLEAQKDGYGNKYYVYINAKTGEIEKQSGVYDQQAIQTAVYNPKLDAIVTLNAVDSDIKAYSLFQLIYVDAVTLEVTKRFDAFKMQPDCVLGDGYAQDVDDAINYAVILCAKGNDKYIGYLIGVNVDTGTVGNVFQFMEGDVNYAPLDVQCWMNVN